MQNCIHILWKDTNNGHNEYNALLNQIFSCMNNNSNTGCQNTFILLNQLCYIHAYNKVR